MNEELGPILMGAKGLGMHNLAGMSTVLSSGTRRILPKNAVAEVRPSAIQAGIPVRLIAFLSLNQNLRLPKPLANLGNLRDLLAHGYFLQLAAVPADPQR